MLVAEYDHESNGLLNKQGDKVAATKLHCLAIKMSDGRRYSCRDDHPEYDGRVVPAILLPAGGVWQNVIQCSITDGLKALAEADLRVGANIQSHDERMIYKFYPWWEPKEGSAIMDLLHVSRLLYPAIGKHGPNTHKVPPKLKWAHSVKAWGYRLGNHKDDTFDPGDWQTWTPEMQLYMLQDVDAQSTMLKWFMSRKPSNEALQNETDWATIIRRQEVWGFTFDYEAGLKLLAEVVDTKAKLEKDLIEAFGSWWEPDDVKTVRATRRVKVLGWPDVTMARYNKAGKRLPKDYVGPPLCLYEEGAKYTPVEYVEFQPGSRPQVIKMLKKRYGWKPIKFTDKGQPTVDDEVLRALPYPEASMLADYYASAKVEGYLNSGVNAWLKLAEKDTATDGCYRVFGQVMTIGTYTFRASHFKPNMAQVPTRDPKYGHRCRSLFTARPGFVLFGYDGGGMQLRLLAHYLAYFDGGRYIQAAFGSDSADPHEFMRDSVGTDLMGEGPEGRAKGKTINYALPFGGGVNRLGSIISPHASESEKKRIGHLVKERMGPMFGDAFEKLKASIKGAVEEKGYITGLDGRLARPPSAHTGLSTLLQMGEKVVMIRSQIILDNELQARGLRCGVDRTGQVRPLKDVDYEWCAQVHDEGQGDVRPEHLPLVRELALNCVTQAGIELGVKCPLVSDFKSGATWNLTH